MEILKQFTPSVRFVLLVYSKYKDNTQSKPDYSDFLNLCENKKNLFYNYGVNYKFHITEIENLLPVSAGSKKGLNGV